MSRRVLPVILLFLFLQVVSAQSFSTLFEADFEDLDAPSELQATGDWEIRDEDNNGFMAIRRGAEGDALLIDADGSWTDYIVELDIRLLRGSLYLDLRANKDNCDGYRFVIDSDNALIQGMLLEEDDDSCVSGEVLAENNDFVHEWSEDWTALKVTMINETLVLSVNHEEVLSMQDGQYAEGTLRLAIADDSSVDIDNLKVSDLAQTSAVAGILGGASESRDDDSSSPESVMNMLVEEDYISEGGELIFDDEGYVWELDGAGSQYVLFDEASYTNVVIGGDFSFSPSEEGGYFDDNPPEYEACGLMARIVTCNCSGNSANYIESSFSNLGSLDIYDQLSMSNTALQISDIRMYDYSDTHNMLMVLNDDEVSVFIDGDVVYDKQDAVVRAGAIGFTMEGADNSSMCEVYNPWAYSLDN